MDDCAGAEGADVPVSERMEREVAQTDRAIVDLRAAAARAAQDRRTARFLELRQQGVPSEKAIKIVDEEMG